MPSVFFISVGLEISLQSTCLVVWIAFVSSFLLSNVSITDSWNGHSGKGWNKEFNLEGGLFQNFFFFGGGESSIDKIK
jgi:hypothetical protein